jgi:hypothetical protein
MAKRFHNDTVSAGTGAPIQFTLNVWYNIPPIHYWTQIFRGDVCRIKGFICIQIHRNMHPNLNSGVCNQSRVSAVKGIPVNLTCV